MKKSILCKTFLGVAVIFTLASCKKETVPPPDTSLTILVTDQSGNYESGATVALFTSTTATDSTVQITDSKGNATFKGLSPIVYYYVVVAGCQSNLGSSNSTVNPITQNTNTEVQTVLNGTGTINFINNSTYSYEVYVNGAVEYSSMNGSSAKSNLFTQGNYTIRVLQLNGYLLTPTDETYTGNVVCGGTLNVSFP